MRIDYLKLSFRGFCRFFLSFYFRWGYIYWFSGFEVLGYILYSVIKIVIFVVFIFFLLNINVIIVFVFLWFNIIVFVVLRKIENEINEDG